MSARAFVDTNLLVYAHQRDPRDKHERARELVGRLWRERSGVLSTQVLQELWVNLRRKAARPMPRGQARRLIADYMTWEVVVNGGDAMLEAIDLEARYRLSFWDALIVQAAHAAAVEVLYSEDLSHGQSYGSVRVVNPFLASGA